MNAFMPIIPIFIVIGVLILTVQKFKRRGSYSPFTEDFLREPGESLRNRVETIFIDLFESFMLAIVVGLMGVYTIRELEDAFVIPASLLFFAIAGYFLYKTIKLSRKLFNTRLGLEGEKATGQELTMLMHDGAWVFHDIPYQYGNIDHIIIATGGVFAVETKAVSKPKSKSSNRAEWKVEYDGKTLKFPHWQGAAPLNQARRHAEYLHKHINKRLSINAVVTPIVAIPGWFVSNIGKSDVWVINPKNRTDLRKRIAENKLSADEVSRIAAHFEALARSVRPASKKLDPDASEHYDFWNKRKYKPPSVD